MPAERVSMRKIREVLRLYYDFGFSTRRIAGQVGIGDSTVTKYLARFRASGLNWPLPEDLGDRELERRLFPVTPSTPARERPLPDWAWVHRELHRRGVTLSLVWQEYREANPDGLGFTAFCMHYRAWARRLPRRMRQRHRAGEKMFVDYAGQTVPVSDPVTGVDHPAQVFIAVMGASSLTYAEASWSQALPDWLASHANAFAFLGGVPAEVVCDNLKAGVTVPDRYAPRANATYGQLAAHYGTVITPTRVRKPRDKAKVEVGVQVVERWILARLRHRRFFSLAELNAAIRELIDEVNGRIMRHMGESRGSLFARLDAPELGALPRTPYRHADVRFRTVGRDYHVTAGHHAYSVPHQLVGAQVEIHVGYDDVEIFHDGRRVAAHVRSAERGGHTTQWAHMPPSHRTYAGWSYDRARTEAAAIGPATTAVIEETIHARERPDHVLRSCAGILRLAETYGRGRLEVACSRAREIGTPSYNSLKSMLCRGLETTPVAPAAAPPVNDNHANVRGARYYR